ncbi:uncharacterized protein A1O9_05718 [Exophiala aquamarina CBS 119918]|uniref:Uncharacterized protein n=1 Tax=Exophiala aquamarina CBS 119918 TaxID=1182545 RepID=A0A072PEX9_9EURO|nr:uncharacterized protein A1O9_05718 [Exophiala aquamarina CBS 119918]KEF57798.1 hypothetical protein A1O9_05718 [Exophiala aquamarina CBS 119918]
MFGTTVEFQGEPQVSWRSRLILRPDDIWLAILIQLKIYIHEHASELRGRFFPQIKADDEQLDLELRRRRTRHRAPDGKGAGRPGGFRERITPRVRDGDDGRVRGVYPVRAVREVLAAVGHTAEREEQLGEPGAAARDDPAPKGAAQDVVWAAEANLRASILSAYNDYDTRTYETKSYYDGWITAFCFWGEDARCQYKIPEYGEGKNQVLCMVRVKYGQIESNCVPDGWMSVPVTRRFRERMVDDAGGRLRRDGVLQQWDPDGFGRPGAGYCSASFGLVGDRRRGDPRTWRAPQARLG